MGRFWSGLLLIGFVGSACGQSPPVRVSGGLMAGQLVERKEPVYPPLARAAGVSGVVVLRAIIDETGHVANLQVVSGPEMLRAAATDAVRNWVYSPYVLNGVATAVDTVVTVNFQLIGGDAGKASLSREALPLRMVQDDVQSQQQTVTPTITTTFCGSPRTGEDGYHLRVSSGVMQGLLKKKVDPVYPQVDAAGAVVMMVCVSAEGAVERVQAVSGPEVLRDAAGRAVSRWAYRPYLFNGLAVPVSTTVTVNFSR